MQNAPIQKEIPNTLKKKQDALDCSRELAKKEGLEMNCKDGQIKNPNSYGNDPSNIIDTKH